MFRHACAMGLEGIVSKRVDSLSAQVQKSYGWTPPKTSWRAPRDHDSVELIANGGVGCGVRPGSSILRSV